jgi:hypothetical protein
VNALLFDLSFYVAVPFWALLILAPTWRWTRRIAGSPWIVAPVLVVWLVLAVPVFPELLAAVTRPSLTVLQSLLQDPGAVALVWAQIIGWDLFIGRWMYLDSRERDVHPLVMAPVLVATILLSPIGLPLYLAIRPYVGRRQAVVAPAAR